MGKVSYHPADFLSDIQCPMCGAFWQELQKVIRANFPKLTLQFEVALAVCGILGIKQPWKPVTAVLEGAAGSGKSLVLNCLLGTYLKQWLYRSDKFSPASFVSQSATVAKTKLKDVDLLPKIRNKVLITPELAPTFRGKQEQVEERFSILARVLDGRGLITDGGTHGRRGYDGDHPFVWLGATTHLTTTAFNAMASVGNRIFFFDMAPPRPTTAQLTNLAMLGGSAENEQAVSDACGGLLSHFFVEHLNKSTRAGRLTRPILDRKEAQMIAAAAWMIARLRAQKDTPTEYEYRIVESLTILACGRAAIEGYAVVLPKHLEIIRHIAISSARPRLRPLVYGLLSEGTVNVNQVQELFGCKKDSALDKMKDLAKTKICKFVKGTAPNTLSSLHVDEELIPIVGGPNVG